MYDKVIYMNNKTIKVLVKTDTNSVVIPTIPTYTSKEVPITKENFTFKDFLYEKHYDGIREGYRTANNEGARYYEVLDYWDDNFDSEVDALDINLDLEMKEYEELFV